jgi:hypothetical protein
LGFVRVSACTEGAIRASHSGEARTPEQDQGLTWGFEALTRDFCACVWGTQGAVRGFHRRSMDPREQKRRVIYMIYGAVSRGDLATLAALVEREPRVMSFVYNYDSPIGLAAFHGHTELVRYMLDKVRPRKHLGTAGAGVSVFCMEHKGHRSFSPWPTGPLPRAHDKSPARVRQASACSPSPPWRCRGRAWRP